MKDVKIEISLKTVLMILAVLIGALLAWQLRRVVFIVFIAFILNSAFRPLVDTLDRKKIPRILSILVIYILFFSVVGLLMANIVAEALRQMQLLLTDLPVILRTVVDQLTTTFPWIQPLIDAQTFDTSVTGIISRLQQEIFTEGFGGVFNFANRAFTSIIEFFTIIVISVYMLERKESNA